MIKKFLALRKEKADKVGFTAKADAGELVLQVYDVIGEDFFGEGITAANFSKAIEDAGEISKVTLRINSPGGDVFEATTIYNMLRGLGKPINALVDGVAASAASVIAMAGDTITMGQGAVMMIHNAMALAFGNAAEMREMADVLDTVSGSIADIYVARTKQDKNVVQKLMDAETWMDAADAVAKRFADGKAKAELKPKAAAASAFNLSVYNNVPESLTAAPAAAKEGIVPEIPEPEEEEDPLIPVMRKRIQIMRARG